MISAVIMARDEAENIERCIRSLLPVSDEVIVLDTGSKDETLQLAEQAGAKTFQVEWKGYAQTKNEGYQQARFNYILSLDADEVLSEELQESILLARENLHGVYRMSRLTFYGKVPVKYCGWYPDPKVRLFPKDKARWVGEFVHEKLVYDPELRLTHLTGDLLHYSIKDAEDHVARAREYARLYARKMKAEGKRFSILKYWLSPVARYLSMYYGKLGILDGIVGSKVCRVSAQAIRWRYEYLRELEQAEDP